MRKIRLVESMAGLPSPMNFSIWWNGGSILGMLLGLQILTGLLLSMHYVSDVGTAFSSVIHIIRDVPGGWAIRSLHANGASLFFAAIYLHIGRGLYYQSYVTQPVTWLVGSTIFLLSMATAFLGYVLPWGQMSFWGATVITNLISAIPYFGQSTVEWVWGGYSVGQPTLTRFFSLHFLLPFAIASASAIHVIALHERGSTSPLGSTDRINKIPFHPYYTWKDIVGFVAVCLILSIMVFYHPNTLMDPENWNTANPLVTPVHIQPEWYFLFAYAILRSIPSKLGGVLALALSVGVLYLLPALAPKENTPTAFCPPFQFVYWIFTVNFFLLTWLGGCPIEVPFDTLSVYCTFTYFTLILLLLYSPRIWKKVF
uniref:Cytochrome b n=1 Tax=Myosotella myosotis TaxID=252580 RepID=B3DFF0_9EUPU|nr:cytochrome b [Myosotella myosotis]ACE62837.1 cytochrome b [Myosotella myosotis]